MAFKRKTDTGAGELFKFENIGDALTGVFVGSFEFEGNYGPTSKHLFKTEKGTKVVFGQKHLTDILKGEEGKLMIVTYASDKRGKKGNPMKMYTLDIDDEYQASAAELEGYAASEDDPEEGDDETPLDTITTAPVAARNTQVNRANINAALKKRPTAN